MVENSRSSGVATLLAMVSGFRAGHHGGYLNGGVIDTGKRSDGKRAEGDSAEEKDREREQRGHHRRSIKIRERFSFIVFCAPRWENGYRLNVGAGYSFIWPSVTTVSPGAIPFSMTSFFAEVGGLR